MFCMCTLCAQAINFIQTEQFITPEDETLTEETWVSAQTVMISGSVSNDLFANRTNG